MFGLIYKVAQYFFTPSPLNKGERDQPPPLEVQERHLQAELRRVHREQAMLAERIRISEDATRGVGEEDGEPPYQ